MSDNMPDFDSMSPEELMAWMESLAKRQGADESTLTTAANMQVAEIDPTTVDVKDNYWDDERLKREEKRRQAAPPPAPAPVPVAAAPPPPPQPEPVVQAAASSTPDFDSMSPEELMAWMESLAKRQGVDESTLVTSANMQIGDVDPELAKGVQDTYWDDERLRREKSRDERKQAAPPPAAAPVTPPVAAAPAPQPEMPEFELPRMDEVDLEAETEITGVPSPASGLDWLENLASGDAEADFPKMDLSDLGKELEGLDLGEGLEALDLGGLSDLGGLADLAAPAEEATDPMDWLNSLTQDAEAAFDLPTTENDFQEETAVGTPVSASQPMDDVDPLEWLESLARRQGVDSEELITDANLDVSEIEASAQASAYIDYSVESPELGGGAVLAGLTGAADTLDDLDTSIDADDPMAWLDSLASAQNLESRGTSTPGSFSIEDLDDEEDVEEAEVVADENIMERLNRAENVSPQDMESWMSNLLEVGAARKDIPDYIEDEDDEVAIEANIPDWLIEQVGGPPPDLESKPAEQAPAVALENLFEEEPVAEVANDMPDWLQASAPEEMAASELEPAAIPEWLQDDTSDDDSVEGIFAVPAEASAPGKFVSTDEMVIDSNDPWVEAFEIERAMERGDTSSLPSWFTENMVLADGEEAPAALPAATTAPAAAATSGLAAASLPVETELMAGQLEAVPDWIGQAMPMPMSDETPVLEAVPSWLDQTDEDESIEMPAWLREQTSEETEAVAEELPDWLKAADINKTDTVPDWLLETVGEDEEKPVVSAPVPVQQPQPTVIIPRAVVPAAASPAPVQVAPAADVAAALQSAQQKVSSGDVVGALPDYEAVIRANVHLDTIVNDLAAQVKGGYRQNAGVHRVLGDALMRQGRLQEALDTYRKALNLL